MLPDFMIIGAMKCGTTSPYNYLKDHSEIAMSNRKEPSYFCHSYDRSLSWYESLFPEREEAVLAKASPTTRSIQSIKRSLRESTTCYRLPSSFI
jgi:hypothetical protein